MKISAFHTLVLVGIFILGFAVRLWKIGEPVADWHSWRQVDTASVARLFLIHGIDLFHPRFHDLSNIPSGSDNIQGYRMVEMPIYQAIAVWVHRYTSFVTIEVVLRIITVAASMGSALILYGVSRKLGDPQIGIIAAFIYAFLPYSIYYGRVILPDPLMTFLSLCAVYFSLFLFRPDGSVGIPAFIACTVFAASSLLVKPVAIFLLIPIGAVFMAAFRKQWKYTAGWFVLFTCMAFYPFWWWRSWIQQYPEGIPAFSWLLNSGNIRFKGAWFYWIFAERIGKLMLGYWGLIPFGFGLLERLTKGSRLFWTLFVAGPVLYLIVIARGNVQHDYYQILLLPAVSILLGRGIRSIATNATYAFVPRMFIGVISVLFGFAFSWYTIRTYYWINHPEIIEAGKAADSLLPKNAKVIAPYNGDTTFLYQTGRVGWPIGFDIDTKIKNGATHYVTISPTDADTETRDLAAMYTVLVRNDRYAIIDLTKRK